MDSGVVKQVQFNANFLGVLIILNVLDTYSTHT